MDALLLDIDSTIYEHTNHRISQKLLKELKRYQKAGFAIIVATSRSQNELRHLPKAFRTFPFDYWILNGGALILDGKGTILFESLIDPEKIKKLSACFAQQNCNWRYVSKEGDYFAHRPSRVQRDIMNYFYLEACKSKAYENEPVYSLLVWLDQTSKELQDLVKDLHAIEYTGAMEIAEKGISKGHAFDWLKEREKIERAIVFGDGDNDLELFERADLSIAPQNASSQVKKRADLICRDVNEDGVALFLEENTPETIAKEIERP